MLTIENVNMLLRMFQFQICEFYILAPAMVNQEIFESHHISTTPHEATRAGSHEHVYMHISVILTQVVHRDMLRIGTAK